MKILYYETSDLAVTAIKLTFILLRYPSVLHERHGV